MAKLFSLGWMVASFAICAASKNSRPPVEPPAPVQAAAFAPPAPSPPPPEPVQAVRVSALTLWNAYQANEVSADQAYKGQTLIVTGRVSSIGKDMFNDVFLSLRSPNEFMGVRANIADSEERRAAALSKGAGVILRCEGAGMIIGSPILNACVFAE